MEAGLPEFLPQSKLLKSGGKLGCPRSAVFPATPARPASQCRDPAGAGCSAQPGAAGGKPAQARWSSEDRSRSHTPRSQPPPRRLGDVFGKLGEATFPGEPDGRRKRRRAGIREKNERDPDQKRESRRAGRPGESGEEADPPRGEGEAQKPDGELWEERRELPGGKARRNRQALPLRPRAVTPGSDARGPRPRGPSLLPPTCPAQTPSASWGRDERVFAGCVCAPAGPRAGETVLVSSACGSAPGAVRASCRRARVGEASRTHQVQSRDTHRVRPQAHSELRRHGRSRREPRRARSPGDPPELRHGRASPKKGDSSPIKKKKGGLATFVVFFFSKDKQNPSESLSCSRPAPLRPQIYSLDLPILAS